MPRDKYEPSISIKDIIKVVESVPVNSNPDHYRTLILEALNKIK